jgi:1,4-dihydroxy-2-naphthoyl-CoA hydrolase
MINPNITLDILNESSKNSMVEHLGIIYTDIGKDSITAKMPVDRRTHQPLGLLHGGASVALAETLGSVAATFSVDHEKYNCVGIEINANHIRSVTKGWVIGTAKPLHLGKSTQIWQIIINNESGELVCISRLTLAVINKNKNN